MEKAAADSQAAGVTEAAAVAADSEAAGVIEAAVVTEFAAAAATADAAAAVTADDAEQLSKQRCSWCEKVDRCKAAFYCCAEHQKLHWKVTPLSSCCSSAQDYICTLAS